MLSFSRRAAATGVRSAARGSISPAAVMARLIVLGNACASVRLPAREVPPAGAVRSAAALDFGVGGSAVNTAVHAARLGIQTSVIGDLGDDLFGRVIRQRLQDENADVSRLRLLAGRSSPAAVIFDHGRGREGMLRHAGTAADFHIPEIALRIPCGMFHLAEPELLEGVWPGRLTDFVRRLRAAGRKVSFDAYAVAAGRPEALEVAREHRHVLGHLEVFFGSEEEAKLISDRAEIQSVANYFHELGTKVVAIKRGAQGAIVSWKGGLQEVPAVRVKVVDAAGAGDAFVAGFLAAYLRGLDPPKCARVGCTLGTLTVRYPGELTATADNARLQKVLPGFLPARAPA